MIRGRPAAAVTAGPSTELGAVALVGPANRLIAQDPRPLTDRVVHLEPPESTAQAVTS